MRSEHLRRCAEIGVDEALERFADLTIQPSEGGDLILAGTLSYRAIHPEYGDVSDSFDVEIRVPKGFPDALPMVRETGGRIRSDFHRLQGGELCLGSLLRIRLVLGCRPRLLQFIERCLIPYLVSFVVADRHGIMPFGELEHGKPGLLDDYKSIVGVSGDKACTGLLALGVLKKRIANKRDCPCGSGKRLGRCHNVIVNNLRSIVGRRFLSQVLRHLR